MTPQWVRLFNHALACLDTIPATGAPMPDWTFGGGTVLMLRYNHRNSHDVDIFLPDPQWLPILDPERNDAVADLAADSVKGPTFLKLVFPEGEVDFIATLPRTSRPYEIRRIEGRDVAVETPTEIIAKKLYYRGSWLRARDVFDFAVVFHHESEALWQARHTWAKNVTAIHRQLEKIATFYDDDAAHLDLRPAGEPFRKTAWSLMNTFIDRQMREMTREYEPDR